MRIDPRTLVVEPCATYSGTREFWVFSTETDYKAGPFEDRREAEEHWELLTGVDFVDYREPCEFILATGTEHHLS